MTALDEVLSGVQKVSSSWVAVAQNSRQAIDSWNGTLMPVFTPETRNGDGVGVSSTPTPTDTSTGPRWGMIAAISVGVIVAVGVVVAIFRR